jgi:hypothetical protein
LEPSTLKPLQGDEHFHGVDATVLDFWRFALGSALNSARRHLAEFDVHKALGLDAGVSNGTT